MSKNEQFMKGDVLSCASEMRKLVNNKEMSDIKFMIGPNRKPVYAHRCILAARCEVFRAMFADQSQKSRDDKEIPFILPDITPDIFLPLMEYIYTNCVTLYEKIALDILGSSIEYGLDGLKQLCNMYLINNLHVNNACDAMQAAVTYGQEGLRDKTLKYIEENTSSVFRSKSFHEMSEDAMIEILRSDKLQIDEPEILACIREWATVNSVVMGKPMSEVARNAVFHIRLPLLTPDELKVVEKESTKDALVPVELLSFAWKCHALKQVEKGNPLTTRRKGTVARDSHQTMHLL